MSWGSHLLYQVLTWYIGRLPYVSGACLMYQLLASRDDMLPGPAACEEEERRLSLLRLHASQ